jgi:hypothetical protein
MTSRDEGLLAAMPSARETQLSSNPHYLKTPAD